MDVLRMFEQELRGSFPLTAEAPGSARRWFSDQGPMPEHVRERVMLPLSELVANSVLHSGLGSSQEVEVSVRSIPGGLHVEVVDQGTGIDDPTPPPSGEHFGLLFVDRVSDRWGYTNRPTRVWFEILDPES